jgi:alcohol dehydrogenase (cytochrome c)
VSWCAAAAGPIEIEEGTINGDIATLRCGRGDGRTITFNGRIVGDEITFTWEVQVEDGGSPVSADAPLFGPSAPRRFIARRVADGTNPLDAEVKALADRLRVAPAVTFDRILQADREPHNWLTYSGNVLGWRFSPLTQITRANVASLGLAWLWQAQSDERFVATPLVVDGVLFTVQAPNDVVALNATTGRMFWRFEYRPHSRAVVCCGRVNRGLAILGDTLFMGTLDAHLLAIDAYTGRVKWDIAVANAADPACKGDVCHAITLAPLVVNDKVIVGIAGGDTAPGAGIRGFIAAFNATTGKEVWRFYTIPQPGEPGNETWSGDSWRTGGAGVWTTGAYDPELNLTYWGTGNPAPPGAGDTRLGDNLYSDSVVALDVDTGALKWHYQFTPHDDKDWDAGQTPVLADIQWEGRLRKVMLWANKNGLMYVLDRATGQFLMGKPFGEVNWMDGFDARGRPVRVTPSDVSNTSTNWFPPSTSPNTGLFYFPVWQPTKEFLGSGYGAVRAFDSSTGERVWEFKKDNALFTAGVLTTGADLLFTGWGDPWTVPRQLDASFYGLDARTGQLLWQMALPGSVRSGPISYAVEGRQYIAVTAGNTLFAFALRP